jgi:hypothetical protein
MPQLDGVGILAIASFAGLVVAWLFAPSAATTEVIEELRPAA